MKKSQAGDTQAFGELVLLHQTYVYNIALRATGDTAEAQDLAQESFLRAWKALPGFKMQSGFRTWLYRITLNLCYNRYAGLKREISELPIDHLEHLLGSWSADPAKEAEKSQLCDFIQQQVTALPSGYRILIQLRYQQGLSYEEIAQIVGVPLGTVKTGLYRAHGCLRKLLMTMKEAEYV